jgi:hypothetical protein
MKESGLGTSVTPEAISAVVGGPPRSGIDETVRPVDRSVDS